jgi:phosphohistidine phosphatase SixA
MATFCLVAEFVWIAYITAASPRARDTAMLLSQGLGPEGVVEEIDHGIGPNDPTDNLKTLSERWHDDAMVVGHLPFMVSHLTTGSADLDTVSFEPGSVVSLDKDAQEYWTVNWVVRPSLLAN